MKILNGSELAGFIKERQAIVVKNAKIEGKRLKLVIIRDSNNPVIKKYVGLKIRYGEDIGVQVIDVVKNTIDIPAVIRQYNEDKTVNGIIVQLPLKDVSQTEVIVNEIAPEKDVDNLTGRAEFDAATATAINWLLAGYNVVLENKKIAIVGKGKLVGAPLFKIWKNSGLDVTVFQKGSDLKKLRGYSIIVTATGVPRLLNNSHIRAGTILVDAGTASEDGVIVGDVSEEVRKRTDIKAITPVFGGVGPLTICALFENVLRAGKV